MSSKKKGGNSMTQNYKLFATDMDGTFLNDQMEYDQAKFSKLYQKIAANNIQFVVASGNQYYQLRSFFEDYPNIIYIAENGAYIRDQQKEYRVVHFKRENVDEILRLLSKHQGLLQELVISGTRSAYVLDNANPKFIEYVKKYYYRLQQVSTFAEINDDILKFSFNYFGDDLEKFQQKLTEKLQGKGDLTTSGHGNFDIIQPGLHKANGLQVLAEEFGIPLYMMCAFGDGGNDFEMLSEVGDGVAVANASKAIKEIADHITDSNNNQGVLNYIDSVFKNG